MASSISPLRYGSGTAVLCPPPGAGAKKAGHLIQARRPLTSNAPAGARRPGEGVSSVLASSPNLIIAACRTFGTRTVLAEAVVVPLALAGLFIAGGML